MWTITMPQPKSAYLKLKFGIIMILEYGLHLNTGTINYVAENYLT
jgi:hypothetical protein